MPSDKVLDLIGIVLVALIGTAGGMWAYLLNRKKVAAEAKKALAEAEAAKQKAEADVDKSVTENDVLANNAAFDSLLRSNEYLQDRLAKQDQRIETLECEIRIIKEERERLLKENSDLRSQVASLQTKYDALKLRIAETFDVLVVEIGKLGEPLIDKHKVIEAIQWAKSVLPKTGPLG